ncbi:MAG TPA: nucleotide exchange factor GrpE [Chloroflexota bacterium]
MEESPRPTSGEPEAVASPSPEETTPVDDVEALRQRVAELERKAEERLQQWQRVQADFINFRRRVEQEREEQAKFAASTLVADLLSVLDDFERAFQTLPVDLQRLTWIGGVALIHRKLEAILERHGLQPIEALGKEFDPYEHEAVLREDDTSTKVVAELQRGYKLHNRVLRPTLVKLGK